MKKEITLTFHNEGLRSYIELDLCCECPRQDRKGCCGWYSPVWYPLDLAFVYKHSPQTLDFVWGLDHLTVLDSSVTINNFPESESYQCRFHKKEGGCVIPQHLREAVCRQFVCIGVNWQAEPEMAHWVEFFERLTDYEIAVNEKLAALVAAKGFNLRNPEQRKPYIEALMPLYEEEMKNPPAFFSEYPKEETYIIRRNIEHFGSKWIL